jgi:hypothetical protein
MLLEAFTSLRQLEVRLEPQSQSLFGELENQYPRVTFSEPEGWDEDDGDWFPPSYSADGQAYYNY